MEELIVLSASHYFAATILSAIVVVSAFVVLFFLCLLLHASIKAVEILDWVEGIALIIWSLAVSFYVLYSRNFDNWWLLVIALIIAISMGYLSFDILSREVFEGSPHSLILSGGLFSLILALIYGSPLLCFKSIILVVVLLIAIDAFMIYVEAKYAQGKQTGYF